MGLIHLFYPQQLESWILQWKWSLGFRHEKMKVKEEDRGLEFGSILKN
jgi:hypothetical protein